MITRRPNMNLILVALVAIAGMLSFGDVASACSTTQSAPAPRACCASRPPSECGCCGNVEAPARSAEGFQEDAEAILAAPVRLSTPPDSPSCECRANESAAPSERPTPRPTSERTNGLAGEFLAGLSFTVRPSPTLSRLFSPNESLHKFPLYLRTSHLLI